jgi:RNA polymerase sigma-70 factor (ECF subfamily)
MDKMSDVELASSALAGSRSCFEQLAIRYVERLFHFLRPRVGTEQDTEDLVQETFLKVYLNLNRYDPAYKFSTWLYTVASRLAISFHRKKRLPETPLMMASTPGDPRMAFFLEEDIWNIWSTARELPPDQFQALWLRYVENMSMAEISSIMKKSRVHIRVLLYRARSKLIEWLNPMEPVKDNTHPDAKPVPQREKHFSFLSQE